MRIINYNCVAFKIITQVTRYWIFQSKSQILCKTFAHKSGNVYIIIFEFHSHSVYICVQQLFLLLTNLRSNI